jgi:sugar-specific transcriptional regulator TrmB
VTANRIRNTLEKTGLSGEETDVYLALLEVGTRPASLIAKKAKLKPGQTYNVLDRLLHRGLIQVIEKGGVKHYSAASPNRLISAVEDEADRLRATREKLIAAIPELIALQAPRLHQSKVSFFHGRNGVTQVVDEAVRNPEKLLLGVHDADTQQMVEEDDEIARFLADARAKRIKSQTWYYALASGREPLPEFLATDYDRLRIVRRLPNLKLPVQFLVYGRKVSVYTYLEPQFALTIDDPGVAESARNMFFKVWETLSDYYRPPEAA